MREGGAKSKPYAKGFSPTVQRHLRPSPKLNTVSLSLNNSDVDGMGAFFSVHLACTDMRGSESVFFRKTVRAYQTSWNRRCRFLFCCLSTGQRVGELASGTLAFNGRSSMLVSVFSWRNCSTVIGFLSRFGFGRK